MTPNDMMRRFAENNRWSNERLHAAVGELSVDEYRATRTSFFPSLHLTLAHILFIDLMYVDALEGGDRAIEILAENDVFDRDGTFAELRELQHDVDERLIVCTAAPLDTDVRIQRGTVIGEKVQVAPRADVLMHLFQHQIHHRGQAHAMLSGTRIAPPQLDEFFIG